MSRAINTKTVDSLAAYRAAARQLSPKVDAPSGQPAALRVGKFIAGVPNFFGDVVAVYKVERAMHAE